MGGAVCTVQLEVRPSGSAAAAGLPATISLKNKREEVETLPLFSSKDTISGEVGTRPGSVQDSLGRSMLVGCRVKVSVGRPQQAVHTGAVCGCRALRPSCCRACARTTGS